MERTSHIIGHIGELFQEYTKYKHFEQPSALAQGFPTPPLQKALPENARIIDLPDPDFESMPGEASLPRLIERRRSRRSYVPAPLTLPELSFLLWATQGVREAGSSFTLRTVPSAGARHPLETTLCLNRVYELAPGLYRYLPLEHKLCVLSEEENSSRRLAEACLGQNMFVTCAVAFIWTTVIERSRWKYQQRAFRYIYLDAGHVCQNLYLACEALGMGCCAVAAFDDDAVNALLDVDGKAEFVIYLATVGRI